MTDARDTEDTEIRHIVGKTMRMSRRDTPPTIIGVMPPGVRFLPSPAAAQEPNYNVNATVDFWMPGVAEPGAAEAAGLGRRRRGCEPGVTLEQAQAELDACSPRGRRRPIATSKASRRGCEPLTAEMNRDGRRILLPLFGAAALVLLIACGNAAALLLVRGLQRQQEYAVRSALGVGRVGALPAGRRSRACCSRSLGGALGVGLGVRHRQACSS